MRPRLRILIAILAFCACSTPDTNSGETTEIVLNDSLVINGAQLSVIPDTIWNSTKYVKYIDLSDNSLDHLPLRFCDLRSIRYLNVSNNYLYSLPDCLYELDSLEKLVAIDYNSFPFDPKADSPASSIEELSRLPHLRTLVIRWRQCSTIPVNIDRLTNVTTLELSGGKYDSLPQELFHLLGLQRLNLMNNNLVSIPPEIARLGHLRALDLSGNQLESVPAEIGELLELEELYLGRNQLTGLPNSFGNLKNLRVLNLSENKFSETEKQRITRMLPSTEITF